MKTMIFCVCLHAGVISLQAQDAVFKSSASGASLIELYSSEGCSSCPPAEEWLNDLKNEPGLWKTIFPIAFHVDYWDGLGWPDRFAQAGYTQRQRDYAARLRQDSVYTPEFILNGVEWQRGWFNGNGIPAVGPGKSGSLTVTASAKMVTATFSPEMPQGVSDLSINVALLGFNLVTDVKRGENGGRTLRHDFVALDFESQPMTADEKGVYQAGAIGLKASTNDVPGAVVAWVSKADGTIVQVAGGWLPGAGK